MMGGMMGGFGSGFGGFGGFGLIGMILNLVIGVGLIVGLVVLILWLWRQLNPGGQTWVAAQHGVEAANSSKEILRARYAGGEIDREQYLLMLTDLG
jgi:putative membrane protein